MGLIKCIYYLKLELSKFYIINSFHDCSFLQSSQKPEKLYFSYIAVLAVKYKWKISQWHCYLVRGFSFTIVMGYLHFQPAGGSSLNS